MINNFNFILYSEMKLVIGVLESVIERKFEKFSPYFYYLKNTYYLLKNHILNFFSIYIVYFDPIWFQI